MTFTDWAELVLLAVLGVALVVAIAQRTGCLHG